jgi:hypothetical protein
VPCQSRSRSQTWPFVKTCGKSRIAVPGSACPEAVLSVPAGPHGIASSDLVRQLFSGKSRTHGHAAESSAVPADPNAARLSGVSGTRSSDPSPECTVSGRAVPMVRDWPSRPACSPAAAASTVPCSSSSGAGPSALRQSRQARSGAGCHRLDQGSRARSPASARITSLSCASGIGVHRTITRIMNAADSSRRYFPLTYLLSRTARPAMPSITPGPACASSQSSIGPSVAWSYGRPSARTCPSLVTTASVTATTFRNTVRPPVRIFSVPPMTSADRSASPRSRPFISGDASRSSGTATIIPAETGTAASGTGQEEDT